MSRGTEPGYLGIAHRAPVVFVQVFMNVGRTVAVKQALYAALAESLSAAGGFRKEDKGPKRNDRIRATEVRVISPKGEMLGIMQTAKALELAREFGVEPAPVGYLPDMFGHVAQMPQILRLAGLEHAVVWRGVPSAGKSVARSAKTSQPALACVPAIASSVCGISPAGAAPSVACSSGVSGLLNPLSYSTAPSSRALSGLA